MNSKFAKPRMAFLILQLFSAALIVFFKLSYDGFEEGNLIRDISVYVTLGAAIIACVLSKLDSRPMLLPIVCVVVSALIVLFLNLIYGSSYWGITNIFIVVSTLLIIAMVILSSFEVAFNISRKNNTSGSQQPIMQPQQPNVQPQPQAQSWNCPVCGVQNSMYIFQCTRCGSNRDGVNNQQ